MGEKYEKQIEQAKDIAKAWKKEADRYKGLFVSLKKDKLAPAKEEFRKIQEWVQKGHHVNNPPLMEESDLRLSKVTPLIETVSREGEQAFSTFNTWSYASGGPRENMRHIAKKLNLGDARSEPYTAVATATKSQLTEVATALADAENAWKQDLKFAVTTLLTSAETVKKILAGNRVDNRTIRNQFAVEVKSYVEFCDKLVFELKLETATKDKDKVSSLDAEQQKKALETNLEKKNAYSQLVQVYAKRAEVIPAVRQMAEKNYTRVTKTVTPELLNWLLSNSSEAKLLNTRKEKLKTQLDDAAELFADLVKLYKEKNLID